MTASSHGGAPAVTVPWFQVSVNASIWNVAVSHAVNCGIRMPRSNQARRWPQALSAPVGAGAERSPIFAGKRKRTLRAEGRRSRKPTDQTAGSWTRNSVEKRGGQAAAEIAGCYPRRSRSKRPRMFRSRHAAFHHGHPRTTDGVSRCPKGCGDGAIAVMAWNTAPNKACRLRVGKGER